MENQSEQASLRQEILERVKTLHGLLLAASYLSAFFIVAGFLLSVLAPVPVIYWFILLIPLVFAPLTFNYQANQMTMEAVAAYLRTQENSQGWESFYGQYKKGVQLTSFLKVLPLLLPQLLFAVLWITNAPLDTNQQLLASIDLALLLLVIANFRYKIF